MLTWGRGNVYTMRRKEDAIDRALIQGVKTVMLLHRLDKEIDSLIEVVGAVFKRHHIVNSRREIHLCPSPRSVVDK